jgi:hypothetical protein
MPIQKSDVKLYKSQLITDADNAGGHMSANELIDGEANNLFPDVSRIDRVYGRVNLRKIFAGVSTADQEPWLGAHAVVLAPPTNERVRALLFSTNSASDTRANARDRVEAYLAQGGDTGWLLYNKHYAGQRQMTWLLRTTDPLPQVGFTYVLLDNAGGDAGTVEYVRVYDVTVVERTFTTFENGAERTFKRNVVTVDIGTSLGRDWDGNEALYFYNNVTIQTKILNTTVADAARYYGIVPLAAPVDVSEEDQQVELETVFESIVPATRSETPMLDVRAVGDSLTMQQSGPVHQINFSRTDGSTNGAVYTRTYKFPRGIKPGSLTIELTAAFDGSRRRTIVDNGKGGFILSSSVGAVFLTFNLSTSAVDYETGDLVLTYTANVSTGGAFYNGVATASPAVAYTDVAHSDAVDITQANRQYNYARNLLPVPTPRSVSVNYRALGVWYRLRDINGDGQLVPDVTGTGSGTIDYSTGACLLTTAAFPDDGSAVIWQWGSGVSLKRRDGGDASFERLEVEHTLAHVPEPGTLTASFLSNGITRNLSANAEGVLSGTGGKGYVWPGTGRVIIEPSPLPDPGAQISFSYTRRTRVVDSYTLSEGQTVSLTLATVPVRPGTVSISVPLKAPSASSLPTRPRVYTDDGAGNMRFVRTWNSSAGSAGYANAGTINYATGEVLIDTSVL